MSNSGSSFNATAGFPVVGLAQLRTGLHDISGAGLSDGDRIDLIEELERVKSAAAAAQARVTAAFASSQCEQALASLPEAASAAERLRAQSLASRSVSAQVALARHESPVRGNQHLGLARALVSELPHTMAALARGDLSEWRATIITRETACLSLEDRMQVDSEIATRLRELGDKRLADTVRGIAQRLDPAAAVRRARKAVGERRISLRPAPDTMAYLTGLLPVAQGVAVFATLKAAADSLHAQGDPRSPAQLMADLLVARVTGQQPASARETIAESIARRAGTWTQAPNRLDPNTDDPNSGAVPAVEIQLVMTDRTLFNGDDEPAYLSGFGPVPASVARRLARDTDKVWIRRLFTRPDGDDLVAMDSHRRTFTGKLRDLLILRDQTCRTQWCDAPVRHIDHVRAHDAGGATSAANGQGLCAACNYTKQSPGWRADIIHLPGSPHTVETTTPTGHRHRSQAPPQPGATRPRSPAVVLDYLLQDSA